MPSLRTRRFTWPTKRRSMSSTPEGPLTTPGRMTLSRGAHSAVTAGILRIVEDGLHHFRRHRRPVQPRQIDGVAEAGAAVLDQRHGDAALQRWAVVAGGDVADHRHRAGFTWPLDDL